MTTVHIAGKGPRRRLTRNRSDKLRGLAHAMHAEPGAAVGTATADAPWRLRTGVGRAVSTGQDRAIAYNPPIGPPTGPPTEPPIEPIATCERPVIAAINGFAAGANIARRGIGRAPGAP